MFNFLKKLQGLSYHPKPLSSIAYLKYLLMIFQKLALRGKLSSKYRIIEVIPPYSKDNFTLIRNGFLEENRVMKRNGNGKWSVERYWVKGAKNMLTCALFSNIAKKKLSQKTKKMKQL